MSLAPFPVTWHWTTSIPASESGPQSLDAAMSAIVRALEAEGKVSINRVDDRLEFESSNFLTRRSRLTWVTAGAITVTQHPGEFRVRFELTFLYLFLFAVAVAVLFWVQDGMPPPNLGTAGPFLFFFGIIGLVVMLMFERLLRRALSSPPVDPAAGGQ